MHRPTTSTYMTARTQPDSFSPRYTGILAVLIVLFGKSTAKKQNFIEEVSKTTYLDTMTQHRMMRNTNSFDPPTDTPAKRATNGGSNTSRSAGVCSVSQGIWFDPAKN